MYDLTFEKANLNNHNIRTKTMGRFTLSKKVILSYRSNSPTRAMIDAAFFAFLQKIVPP